MIRVIVGVIIILSMFACQDNQVLPEEKTLEEIRSEGPISSIIRNPVSATVTDTTNVAKITFKESVYDFGIVKEGAIVKKSFQFTNTGKIPLVINDARSTCGCTVPEWPKEPIPPGKTGTIKVKFDTKNKRAQQSKPITITANTYPSETKIYLSGVVRSAS